MRKFINCLLVIFDLPCYVCASLCQPTLDFVVWREFFDNISVDSGSFGCSYDSEYQNLIECIDNCLKYAAIFETLCIAYSTKAPSNI